MKVRQKRLSTAMLAISLAAFLSGCSEKENGYKPFVPPTSAQAKAYRDQQIKSIQDNPNIPAGQKASIIAMYQNGAQSGTLPPPRQGSKQ